MNKLLIIEDDAIIAKDLKMTLESAGFIVCGILNGSENIIEEIERLDPDIILSDIYIKNQNTGIEILKTIQEKEPKPLIFISAYSTNDIIEHINGIKHDGFIVKPFTDAQVIATVKLVASKHNPNNLDLNLSCREKEIMQLMINGLNTSEIASHLYISPHTVKSHRKNIYEKLEVTSISQLILKITTHYN